jgi:hypothetical protein
MVCFQSDAETADEVGVFFPISGLLEHLTSYGIAEDEIDERALMNQALADAIPRALKAVNTRRFAIVMESWHVPRRSGESDQQHASDIAAWYAEQGPDSLWRHPRREEQLSIVAFDRDQGTSSLHAQIKRVGQRRKPRLQPFRSFHRGPLDELDGRIPNIARYVFSDQRTEPERRVPETRNTASPQESGNPNSQQ